MADAVLTPPTPTNSPHHQGAVDWARVRDDFPILKELVYGKPLTFLDSGASAQKPQSVIDAVEGVYQRCYANIHRGIYKFSQEATEAYEATRGKVQRFINAKHEKECLFVRGATEGINLVAQTWGREHLRAGDVVLLSQMEHHSNIVPWQLLRDQLGFTIKVIPVLDDGSLDMDAYAALLGPEVKLVGMVHVSNTLGTIVDIKRVIQMAHDAGAVVMVDGCQAAPHMAVDVQDLDADFYAFSAHKIYGPTGIGVLYGKETLLDKMPPWQGGGDMIETVTFEKTTFNILPQKFEAGTPNIAGGIGFGAALDYVTAIGFDAIETHEKSLLAYASEKLTAIQGLRMIGTAADKAAICSFVLDGIHPHDAGTILDREGICVRTGHHCTQPVMDRFDVPATVRASFGIYNNFDDIDRLVDGLAKVQRIFAL